MSAISRILLPVDFSECSRTAIDEAATLAIALNATVDLLHVWQPLPRPYTSPLSSESTPARWEFDRTRAMALLNELAALLRQRGVTVAQEWISEGDPGDEIDALAEKRGYDLIVVGTHGRGGFRRLLLGSVAGHVVQHARRPVLVVPP